MADTWKILENIANARSTQDTEKAGDPQGQFPRAEYWYKSSLTKENHQLNVPGDPTIDIVDIMSTTDRTDTDYSDASVKQTSSGHVLLFDDKHGSRRILLKHENGTGIEMRNDGTMIMRTENNIITSVGGSGVLMVEGDLKVSCKNLEIDATGDLDMRVEGDYKLNVKGNKREFIQGHSEEATKKNKYVEVVGNMQTDVVKNTTSIHLGDVTNIVKGKLDNSVQGEFNMNARGSAHFSSMMTATFAAPNTNISAEDLTVVGAGGTIGGENMIYYAKNYFGTSATYTAGVTAPTFHGDLNGKADKAGDADTSANSGAGGGSGTFDTATNTTQTSQPTSGRMAAALRDSKYGYRKVKIDEGDGYKNKIDLDKITGGVSNRTLSLREIRAKLKDPSNSANGDFITYLESTSQISKSFALDKIPPGQGRSYDGNVSYIAYNQNLGVSTDVVSYIKSDRQVKKFIPDSRYNPMRIMGDPRRIANSNLESLGKKISVLNTGKALLGAGIPISTFLLEGVRLTDVTLSIKENLTLTRQLLLQAEVIKFKKANKQFEDQNLTVVEGVYNKYSGENLTSSPASIPFLATSGRAITYELHDSSNKQSAEVSFNFAVRLAESLFGYDKVLLNYDTLQEDKINIQITVVMPEVDEDYNPIGLTQFKLETVYNNEILSQDDLIEIVSVEPNKSVASRVVAVDEKIKYSYDTNTIRDRKVNEELETVLANAARTVNLDYVEIYSGKQPGTNGKSRGSGRHNTGLAADIKLYKNNKALSSFKHADRLIMTDFIIAAIDNGILAGGHGPEQNPKYMDDEGMHLDMLGAFTGNDRIIGSGYDKKTKVVWRSDSWFRSAFGFVDA
jgi:hypothetical protein